jgi:hypothetical protein
MGEAIVPVEFHNGPGNIPDADDFNDDFQALATAHNDSIARHLDATGAPGEFVVCDASGVPQYVAFSGDLSVDEDGVATLTSSAVGVGGATGSSLALTVSAQDVPGTSLTITPTVASKLLVVGTFEFYLNASGPILMNAQGLLSVDGSLQTNVAQFRFSDSDAADHSANATVGQSWVVPLTAAAHTVKLRAALFSGTSITGSGSLVAASYSYILVKA